MFRIFFKAFSKKKRYLADPVFLTLVRTYVLNSQKKYIMLNVRGDGKMVNKVSELFDWIENVTF